MKPPEPQPAYHSYVLRLWCTSGEEAAAWCASLEEIQTGERVGFAHLEALIEYLRALVGGATGRGGSGDDRSPAS